MLSIWSESPYCKRTAVSRSHKQLTMPWCLFWMDSTIQPLATFENLRTNLHSDCGTVANQRCQKQDRRTNLCPIGNRLLRNLRLLELCPIQSNEMFVSKVSQLHSAVLFFIPPISGNTPCTKRLVVAFVASKFHCATQSAHSKQASPALSYKPYISCSQHTADQNAACSQAVFRHQDHVLGRSMAPDNALSEFSWQNLPPPILVEEPFDACKRMPRTATYLGQNSLKDVMGSYFCTNLKMLTWLCKWFKLERGVKERCSSMAFFSGESLRQIWNPTMSLNDTLHGHDNFCCRYVWLLLLHGEQDDERKMRKMRKIKAENEEEHCDESVDDDNDDDICFGEDGGDPPTTGPAPSEKYSSCLCTVFATNGTTSLV